jgi:hypothetical protein
VKLTERAKQVLNVANKVTGVPIYRILAVANQTWDARTARVIVYWMLYHDLGYSLSDCGRVLGVDHSSVRWGLHHARSRDRPGFKDALGKARKLHRQLYPKRLPVAEQMIDRCAV